MKEDYPVNLRNDDQPKDRYAVARLGVGENDPASQAMLACRAYAELN